MRSISRSRPQSIGVLNYALSYLLLLLPTGLLAVLAARTESPAVTVAVGVQLLLALGLARSHPVWHPPTSGTVVVLYLIGAIAAWAAFPRSGDWVPFLVQGLLLLVAVALYAYHDLVRTGTEPLRRANKWSRRISARRGWPPDLTECRTVPEAVALRAAMRTEPAPALSLLADKRPQVQVAALGALEHHTHWRSGEAEMVVRHALRAPEPAVRAAAVFALAGVETADLIADLAAFLRDPSVDVRLAAAEALMWNADARWPFAREAVKEALADPKLVNEGPMFATAGRLPGAAVADLISWSAEQPPLAKRAILTVVEHFNGDLLNAERPELANELATMMLDTEMPPALRVELAGLLRDHHMLTPDLLDRLTNLNQPAPMRLFAAELMLRLNPSDPDGVDVLRGLARQPNRELALSIAAVLQNTLGIELGLPSGDVQPQSKTAADVARRVLAWANGGSADPLRPTPGPRPGLKPGSRPRAQGLGTRPPVGPVPTPPADRPRTSPLDESMLPPPDVPAYGGRDHPAPYSPLDESMLAPPGRSPLDESMLAPPPRSPLDDSMLLEGEALAEEEVTEDLLRPPQAPYSPLDESMLAPDNPPVPPPKPFKRPGPGSVF
ncbi:hypothetical protein : : HEAT_2 [Gemmataceae bacterium]|nr:hypothetical protein : : HEAT_2 [Gemmataceae bacterium]VTT97298.1 hypothetical protein : : HEAT_2 [Gemmataceae bacterium]